MKPAFLSADQIEQFLTRGHVVIRDAFSRSLAREMTQFAFVRLGYDPNDPAAWKKARIHMPATRSLPMGEFAPRAFAAACDLAGGEDRIHPPTGNDGFIINFNQGADEPWRPPSAQSPGWHKDGDWFLHFLDSPEQGLLMIWIFSDIAPRGGGTFVACDSVAPVARFLAQRPEGVEPNQFPFGALARECEDFIEMTGRAGDVVLLHPFILHTISQNHSGVPRFITNPAIHLRAPMNFNRADPADFSPLERAVLRGLGVERLDFQPTSPRRRIVPEREHMQKKMREEERARLAAGTPARSGPGGD